MAAEDGLDKETRLTTKHLALIQKHPGNQSGWNLNMAAVTFLQKTPLLGDHALPLLREAEFLVAL